MNVLLINPASPNIARISTDFDLEISNSGRFPPIGLLFLAAYILKHSKHNVKIIDMEVENFTNEGILHFIKENNTDIIGITSFTYTFYDKYINSKVLSHYYTKSYKMYYRRPGYILNNLLGLRSFSELKNKLPVAINVLLARKKSNHK